MIKSHFSVEELLSIAKKEPRAEKLTQVEQFILDLNVKSSDEARVDGPSVYWVYKRWCSENDKEIANRKKFHKEFGKKFKRRRNDKFRSYYVDATPFKLSKDEWWEMRRDYRAEKEKKAKKSSKKSQS